MRDFLDTLRFILSTMGTFIFIVIIGAICNNGSISFSTSSFGFLVLMAISFFLNLILYYLCEKYHD